MRERFFIIIFMAMAGLLSASCTDRHAGLMARQLPEGMQHDFMQYYKGGDYKAFVVAIDDDDVWAFGSAYNAKSMVEAKGWAMKRCKIAKRRESGLEADCRLFAVGNEFAG